MVRPRLPTQRTAALLVTAFLFPLGAATVMMPWLLWLRVAEIVRDRRMWWVRSPVDLPLGAFVVVGLIAGVLSPYPQIGLGSWALGALGFAVAFQLALTDLERTPGLARGLHRAFALGTLCAALFGLAVVVFEHADRARLPTIGADAFAFGLAAGVFLTFPLFNGPRLWRVVAALTVIAAVVAILASFTRAALYAAVAGSLVHFAQLRGARARLTYLGFVAAAAAVGIVGVLLTPQIVGALAGHLVESNVVQGPVSGVTALRKTLGFLFSKEGYTDRLFIWEGFVRIVQARPWFGVGLGVSPFVIYQWDQNLQPGMPAHSLYLDLASEVGIPGTFAFLAIPAVAIVSAVRRRDPFRDAAIAAVVGMLAAEIRDTILLGFHMAIGFMLTLALLVAQRDAGVTERPVVPPVPAGPE